MTDSPLTISIGGSSSHGGGSSPTNVVGSIGEDYSSLIAEGSDAFAASGAKIFNMDAGALSLASAAQIGRIVNGVTVTAEIVAQNQIFLNKIGEYCRNNGISVHVEAQLTNSPANDWTYQWLYPAVQAGLPITAVENDDEVEPTIAGTTLSLAQRADNEVRIVSQITKYYPSVSIGQWETEAPLSETQEWWNTYNAAAAAAHLPGISYVVADTPWNAPWMHSQTDWEAWQLGLSNLAASQNVKLEILIAGVNSAASGFQWTAQAEQHAAMLATLPGLKVSTLLIRTWDPAHPDSILPSNRPTTLANAAAEISAVYPLYNSGEITGTAKGVVNGIAQALVPTGSRTLIQGLTPSWGGLSASPTEKYAIVIMSGTGLLYAEACGSAFVSGAGTTKLVLTGTRDELSEVLRTLAIQEPFAGPDNLDVELFGALGRLSDAQFTVFSIPASFVSDNQNTVGFLAGLSALQGQHITINASSVTQQWISASVTLGSAGFVVSEELEWNSSGYDPVQNLAKVARTISIHEPIAEQDVTLSDGVWRSSSANPNFGSVASLPIAESSMVVQATDVSAFLFPINVLHSTLIYDDSTGKLERQIDQLAPSTPTALLPGSVFLNYFSDGGRQVTEFNTGNNPAWSTSWNPNLLSVTTTYGSSGQMLEQTFQGGQDTQYFTLDNVYNPYTGALWEQIQSTPAASPYGSFVTGSKYVTQFNTGDNPNWNYVDWGNAPQVTVVWQDWKVVSVTTLPPVPTGQLSTFAYGASGLNAYGASGSVSMTGTIVGSTLIGGDGTTTIVGAGHDTIYTGRGTTTLNTGGGASRIQMNTLGSSQVSVFSGGGDALWTGLAVAEITNVGTLADEVHVQGGTVTVNGVAVITSQTGTRSTIRADGSGVGTTIDLQGTLDVAAIGNGGTIVFHGSGSSVTAGTDAIVNAWGAGNTLVAGDTSRVWLTSGQNRITTGAKSQVVDSGVGNTVTVGASSTVFQNGKSGSLTAGSGSTINQTGSAMAAITGDNSSIWMAGDRNSIVAGANATIGVVGASNSITVGDRARINGSGVGTTIDLQGTLDVAAIGNGGTIVFHGSGSSVTAGTDAIVNAWGAGNTLVAGDTSRVWLTSGQNRITTGAKSQVVDSGVGNTVTVGASSTVFQNGKSGSLTAGSGSTINQTGSAMAAITGDNSSIWMAGDRNSIVAGANATIGVVGASNSITVGDRARINGSGVGTTIDLQGTLDVAAIGNGGTIVFHGSGSSVTAGTDAIVNAWGAGNTLVAGDTSRVWLTSGQNRITTGAKSQVVDSGVGNTVTVGASSTVFQNGKSGSLTAGSGSTINQTGSAMAAITGDNSSIWMAGDRNSIVAGANATIGVVGASNSITVGDRARINGSGVGTTIDLQGTLDVAAIGNGGTIVFHGSGSSVTAGTDAIVNAWGAGNTLVAGDTSRVWLTSGQNRITTGAKSQVVDSGVGNTVTVGASSTVFQNGKSGSLTAGSGSTINQTGSAMAAITGDNSSIWMAGDRNSIVAGANATIGVVGASNSITVGDRARINGSGVGTTIDLQGTLDVAAIGNGGTIVFHGSGSSVTAGTDAIVNAWGAGNTLVAGDTSRVWLTSGQNRITTGAKSQVVDSGVGNTVTVGASSTVFQNGKSGSLTAGSGSTINQTGSAMAAITGDNSSIWMAGDRNSIVAGANATIGVVGNQNTVVAGSLTSLRVSGSKDTALVGDSATVTVAGDNAVVVAGSNLSAKLTGTADTLIAGEHSDVTVNGGSGHLTLGGDSTVVLNGNMNSLRLLGLGRMTILNGSSETVALPSVAGTQTIKGFSLAKHDVLDLSAILDGVPIKHDFSNIGNYLSVTNNGTDSVLTISASVGKQVVALAGARGLSVPLLLSQHALILPNT